MVSERDRDCTDGSIAKRPCHLLSATSVVDFGPASDNRRVPFIAFGESFAPKYDPQCDERIAVTQSLSNEPRNDERHPDP